MVFNLILQRQVNSKTSYTHEHSETGNKWTNNKTKWKEKHEIRRSVFNREPNALKWYTLRVCLCVCFSIEPTEQRCLQFSASIYLVVFRCVLLFAWFDFFFSLPHVYFYFIFLFFTRRQNETAGKNLTKCVSRFISV